LFDRRSLSAIITGGCIPLLTGSLQSFLQVDIFPMQYKRLELTTNCQMILIVGWSQQPPGRDQSTEICN